MAASTLDINKVRSAFTPLREKQVFMDNAGGTQTLDTVANCVRTYLMSTNAQLGATYPISSQATHIYEDGYQAAAKYVNAKRSEIVLGSATTQNFANLADSMYEYFTPGESEIILSYVDHEANLASWVRLAKRLNLKIIWWKGTEDGTPDTPPKTNPILTAENLKPLLSERTRLVACTHSSNILGTVHDIKSIAAAVHTVPGALICIDGVAFTPHAPIDVKAAGVDFYGFSWYKVYGPHNALLYVSEEAQNKALGSLGHYFKTNLDLEERLGLAGSSYELVAGIPKVTEYLAQPGLWKQIAAHEEELQGLLLGYLTSRDDVTIYGVKDKTHSKRMPVISFTVKGWKSKDIVDGVESRSSFGIRYGHFYAHRLVTDFFGLSDDGVVRVSFVHYNTVDEVKGLINTLDDVLEKK